MPRQLSLPNRITDLPLSHLNSICEIFDAMRIRKKMMTHTGLKLKFWVDDKINAAGGNLRYINACDESGLAFFKRLFDGFGFKSTFPSIRLYGGCFMQRSRISREYWHKDSDGTDNKMKNIIIPMNQCQYGHLLVGTREAPEIFEYKFGEARVNYDRDWHSSQPYKATSMSTYLVFMCGDVTMSSKQDLAGQAFVKDTCVVYYDINGRVMMSDEIFYDSDE